MASGWSKATGKLPAVLLHTTVGTLHAAMTLRSALHERVPMVVMAGESIAFGEPPAPMVGRQWLRLLTDTGGPARLIEPCVKWSCALNAAGLLPQTVQRACQLALNAPRGPVFVSVPIEHLMETLPQPLPAASSLPRPAAAEPAALDSLAQGLAAAKSPLIITEEAGRDPAAVGLLVALAEALGAPVAEAWQPYYLNFPRDHRLYAGVISEGAGELLAKHDSILLADAVLPWHPPSSLPAGKTVYAIGEDPLRSNLPYWGFRTDMVVPGELRTTLQGLLERISPKASSIKVLANPAPAAEAMGDAWIAQALNEALPADAIVVNETITHRLELLRRLTRLQPGGFYESSFGGLGVGLSTALGVKHAHSGRVVAVTIGDGAFHYNPVAAAFGASQELNLPLLVVLFDNAGYLSQKTDVKTYYPAGEAVRSGRFAGTGITPRPEYAKLAQAYGGYGERVERPQDVRAALRRGLEQQGAGRLALIHMVLP
jgi:acetolactate synthase-1/2/3 large subunit